ncbi:MULTISPECIES: hypothetical protein [unclassified Photobacterium]|uniref:hypothetical protein n=1 Tax=unclassified Photobacterium TaxID=2628852 RepID=UPI001EE0D568|nr:MULTISPECIES: hypothetical protein [unclassified Photobacterium]MCG3863453.1 hypothetical protein [Photobacterium sp. Ph6]MCG3874982.1 hypothetical protein [Photobacterium sp. Ph5]
MAAEKLTRGRLIQIVVLMTILISAFIWRTVTYTNSEDEISVENRVKTCQLDTENCQYLIDNKNVNVQLLTKELSAQAPIRLQITNIDVKPLATVSGVSMNMGTVPIVFTQHNKNTWVGEFTVPACTHNTMVWGIDITAKNTTLSSQFTVTK